MYYSLRGKLIHTEPGVAVIECGGVGYKCFVSMTTIRTLPRMGEEVMLYTHLNVREDAMDLYGFQSSAELQCFKMLTNITGVGPKVGLAILSELTPENVAMAAASGDAKAFSRANGVGPKLAQRITLELKDKVKGMLGSSDPMELGGSGAVINNASSNAASAVQALGALGYSPSEAAAAVGRIDSSLKTEEIIRQALRALAKF